ncbi:DNA polymerase III subunit gamma/tau [Arcanobacterium hippocoleae]|uniref:DNA polymerase III subunit gamma/tau n=1 Tax=Arcanobacterium hippocoleae TaxID=149017 RepID=UPI00334284B4
MNCIEYPTPTPCGECESCQELAREGSGSLDVVELDAASHGGVDDARELREQASFAPVRDRFKIFIIDEAHMVTTQGFNALLKLVEEPPPHVKFIFATTEPEKVIGTIRSRTHHYPFRLVPPPVLEDYLSEICRDENIDSPREVLSLVVRAGTGSVRDTLSVLDQIIGGSDGVSLDYERAVALLGYTSAHLLDEAIMAISNNAGLALFKVVDAIVTSGHDPRRFVEDLLQRLRDLVILSLAGESTREVFIQVPDDQFAAMVEQAKMIGAKRASLCADFANQTLSTMVGATAPRLQLELLCARLLMQTLPDTGRLHTVAHSSGEAASLESAGADALNQSGMNTVKNFADSAQQPKTAEKPQVVNPLSAPMPGVVNPLAAPMPQGGIETAKPHLGQRQEQSVDLANNGMKISATTGIKASAMSDSAAVPSNNMDPKRIHPNSGSGPQVRVQAAENAAISEKLGSPEFAKIVDQWPDILQISESKSSAVAAIMEHSAGAAALERNVLSIYFDSEKWAANFNQTIPALDVVARAVYAKTGLKTRVQGVLKRDVDDPGNSVKTENRMHTQTATSKDQLNQEAGRGDVPRPKVDAPQNRAEHLGAGHDLAILADAAVAERSAAAARSTVSAQDAKSAAKDPVGVLRPLLDEVRGKLAGLDPADADSRKADTDQLALSGQEEADINAQTLIEAETAAPVQAGIQAPERNFHTDQAAPAENIAAVSQEQPFYRQELPKIPPAAISHPDIPPVEILPTNGQVPLDPRSSVERFGINSQPSSVAAAHFNTAAFTSLTAQNSDPMAAKGSSAPSITERLAAHTDGTMPTADPFAALNMQGPIDAEEFSGDEWDEVSVDDPSVAESTFVGVNVVLEQLSGKIIEEIPRNK